MLNVYINVYIIFDIYICICIYVHVKISSHAFPRLFSLPLPLSIDICVEDKYKSETDRYRRIIHEQDEQDDSRIKQLDH